MIPARYRGHCLFSLVAALAALAPTFGRAQHIAKSPWLSPSDERAKLKVPPGFELQLFASEPAIHKPLNMTFDRQGRMWVTDTVEYPNPVGNEERGRDTVKVLVDTNHDGAADQVTTFVDGLNIPIGVQPIDRGVIVFSIPNIWRCQDTDGDGKADTKEKMFGPFGREDTHGLNNSFTRGLDGWLYATHGYSNTSTIAGTDGKAITMTSGNTYRMKLDGSHVEYFCHGQVNPFGLAFDPLGNLFSADCHTLPLYQLLRGACYPSFGKAHDGLDFGPTMVDHDHGSTAISGIVYYAADQFPPEYRDNIFVGNPVTCRINRDRMERHGATYIGIEMPDLVSSDDPWFRPVALALGPDGALYIADFYNRIIGHYEVPLNHPGRDRESGRIWRLVYTGKGVEGAMPTTPPVPPKASEATPDQLVAQLGDPNLTVRTLATHEFVDRVGQAAIPLAKALLASKDAKPCARAHALWVLERLSSLDDQLVESLASDADPAVRVHLMKALSERPTWSYPKTNEIVRKALADQDAFVRRAAVDALGRHPSAENLAILMELWTTTPADDTHLVHTARMALRDQLAAGFYPQAIALAGDDRAKREQLANVSLGVPSADAAKFLFGELKAETPGSRDLYLRQAIRHIPDAELPDVYHFAMGLKAGGLSEQAAIAQAIAQASRERGATPPKEITEWSTDLIRQLLSNKKEGLVRAGIDLASDCHTPGAFDFLSKAAARGARFDKLRQPAIDACVGNDAERSVPLLDAIIGESAEPMKMRVFAAQAMGRLNSDAARAALGKQLPSAPDQLAAQIAGGLSNTAPGAEILLSTISAGKASARLLQGGSVSWRLRARKLPNIEERLAKLTAGLPPEDAQIAKLIKQRRQVVSKVHGDAKAGSEVFTKTCAACHRIAEVGGKVGPNLDGIGIRGLDRILEDVLDPNRNVDQSFRTTQIATKDGEIITGLALREEGKVIVLADPQGKEVRVSKDDVDERTVSSLSLMPSNIAEQLPEQDFANLMEYLMSQRQPAAKQ